MEAFLWLSPGSTSRLLRERGATAWFAAVNHPMVAEIGNRIATVRDVP